MKKILYMTTISNTTSAFLVPHIETLINAGYEVECAFKIVREPSEELKSLNLKMYDIPFERTPFSFSNIKAFKMLIKLCKENKYDAIHVHTPVASVYGRLLKLKFPKMKIVYTAHGYHFLKGGSKAGWILYYPTEKIMSFLTDALININKDDYNISKNKFHAKKTYYVPGVGIDLNNYKILSQTKRDEKRLALNLSKDDFIISMVADLNFNKNQIQLINAMEILKDKYKNIKVLLIGSGEKHDELSEIIKQKALEKNVFLIGQRTDVNELINISNMGTLLSYREGLPRCIMEFMANGKKFLATDIRGSRDLVCNESIGLLVGIGDYKETANIIEKYYLTKDNTTEAISEEIYQYKIENVNKQILDIFNELF